MPRTLVLSFFLEDAFSDGNVAASEGQGRQGDLPTRLRPARRDRGVISNEVERD